MSDEFTELDEAARANLTPLKFRWYQDYKAELISSGKPADWVQDVLRGFIWDESEDC